MQLLIKFTDKSASFSHGVEFGRILNKLERQDESVDNCGFPVRIENIEVLKLACKTYGYTPVFGKKYYDEWIQFMGVKNVSLDN